MTQAANLAALGTNASSTGILPAAGGGTAGTAGVTGFKNRIINGAMVIDQRNSGASINNTTTGTQYSVDRWAVYGDVANKFSVQQNAGSVTPPAGFTKYLGVTSLSSYSVPSGEIYLIQQPIEGYNIADLAWGTANAATVTLSFWVRSSLTGSFGGVLKNNASSRSYPFAYTISSANTWEQKSITIPGDTTGTWATDTTAGIRVNFSMGAGSTYQGTANTWASAYYNSATGTTNIVGTNGATWYMTGCQLEVGSAATNFDFRDYGRELIMCQRYYEKCNCGAQMVTVATTSMGYGSTTANWVFSTAEFLVQKRAAPTMTINGTGGGSNVVSVPWFGTDLAAGTGALWTADVGGFNLWNQSGTNTSPGNYAVQYLWKASAEL